jgi:hypothetical protein
MENEGKFDFLWLVVKFGFEGEGTFTFCKMRWLVGVMTAALNLHSFVSKANERNAIYGKIYSNEIPYHSNRFSNFFGVCGEGGFAATDGS